MVNRLSPYVIGIYADVKEIGITLIATNKEIDTYWVFDHIYHKRGTIEEIKNSLDDLLIRFPEIRKIHINDNKNLRQQLNNSHKKKLFTNGIYKTKSESTRSERRSDVKIIDFEVKSLAFILDSYINDGKLIFNNSLLVEKYNLKSEIENCNFKDINIRIFSLYIAISQIEPIKSRMLCASIPQPQDNHQFLY